MLNTITPLEFKCRKVLPLVYDDSLSYYEVLCKVRQKLNEVIDNNNELTQAWEQYKSDIDAAFGKYTDELDKKFDKLSDDLTNKIEDEITIFRTMTQQFIDRVEKDLSGFRDELDTQNTNIENFKNGVTAQLQSMTTQINSFIAKYNDEIAKLPQYTTKAVNDWLNDTTNYDNIIADLSGQIQGLKHFDTVAQMTNSSFTQITGGEVCVCENFYSGDGVFTMWEIVPFNSSPDRYADNIARKLLKYESSDLHYRVAVLRSEFTATTLGLVTQSSAAERANMIVQMCKNTGLYNPLQLDGDFSVNLSSVNTTTGGLSVYCKANNQHTMTLTGANNFIYAFNHVRIMHSINNIKHNVPNYTISFAECVIDSNPGATVIVPNINIKGCTIKCTQIQSTDELLAGGIINEYVFSDNTWLANTIFGLVLQAATVDTLPTLTVRNNMVYGQTASRTRLLLCSNVPAENTTISHNIIRNDNIGADLPVANGVLAAFTSLGTKAFTMTVCDNTIWTSQANTLMTLGNSNDNVTPFTLLYKDNVINLNSGTTENPAMHYVLSTEITTNGRFYSNFVGDLDTSAILQLAQTEYKAGDLNQPKVIPFNPSSTVGFVPEADGSLAIPENLAYYRADVDLVCINSTAQAGMPYLSLSVGGVSSSHFLLDKSVEPLQHILSTVYLTPKDLSKLGGYLSVTITSNATTTFAGSIKLFRMA